MSKHRAKDGPNHTPQRSSGKMGYPGSAPKAGKSVPSSGSVKPAAHQPCCDGDKRGG